MGDVVGIVFAVVCTSAGSVLVCACEELSVVCAAAAGTRVVVLWVLVSMGVVAKCSVNMLSVVSPEVKCAAQGFG